MNHQVRDDLGRMAHAHHEASLARMIDGYTPGQWSALAHEEQVAWRDTGERIADHVLETINVTPK